MDINSRNLDLFRKDFNKQMEYLEKRWGVNVNLGRLTYDDNEFRGKIIVKNGKVIKRKELSSSDFRLGNRVKVNHKKVSPDRKFTIIKINKKSITISEIDGFTELRVHPSLLEKI